LKTKRSFKGTLHQETIQPKSSYSTERQPDSTHILVCPQCINIFFVNESFIKEMNNIEKKGVVDVVKVGCTSCRVFMEIAEIEDNEGWQNWDDVERVLEG
jgi:hypothetical protein